MSRSEVVQGLKHSWVDTGNGNIALSVQFNCDFGSANDFIGATREQVTEVVGVGVTELAAAIIGFGVTAKNLTPEETSEIVDGFFERMGHQAG
jgi:hypothetical protein